MRAWLACLVVLPAVAGCLGGDDEPLFDGLDAPGASVRDEGDVRILTWQGEVGPGLGIPLAGTAPLSAESVHDVPVDGRVGYVSVRLSSASDLIFTVADAQGRVACGGGAQDVPCSAPVQASRIVDQAVTVTSRALTPSNNYTLTVELHPASHMTFAAARGLSRELAFNVSATGADGGEPTLGVLSDGTILVQNSVTTLRSTDDGATWQDVSPPWAVLSLDPMLYADPWTGRVYADQLYVACSYMYWSDDAGDNWILNPVACGDTAIDHQKVTVGGHPIAGNPLYDGTVYFSFNSFTLLVDGLAHLVVSRSLDGGLTWTPSVAMTEALDFPYRTGGPVVADRAGNVYVGAYLLDGGFAVTSSHDFGVTWDAVRAADDGAAAGEGIDPGVAIDTAGNVYGAYWGPDGVYAVASTNGGSHWLQPARVSPGGLASFVLVDAVAGDEGRVAIAYLATADTARGPNGADGWARWHLFVSITEDALAPEPLWHTAQVTPDDDPVQIGSICTGGTGCFGGNRNLLDFIDIQPGPDGRVYVAYTDGCDPAGDPPCEGLPQTSRENHGMVAVQESGPRLFVDGAPWAA